MILLSHHCSAVRASNRIRLVGMAALAICMVIAISGLLHQQQIFTPPSPGPDGFWTPQR